MLLKSLKFTCPCCCKSLEFTCECYYTSLEFTGQCWRTKDSLVNVLAGFEFATFLRVRNCFRKARELIMHFVMGLYSFGVFYVTTALDPRSFGVSETDGPSV